MTVFTSMVQNLTTFLPYLTLYRQRLERILPVPKKIKHIQILHSPGHWICTYYDTNCLYIYDSLNNKTLHESHILFLRRLYPDLDEIRIVFPEVQSQMNSIDCGVHAIAIAISLLFNIKPETVKYNRSLMR